MTTVARTHVASLDIVVDAKLTVLAGVMELFGPFAGRHTPTAIARAHDLAAGLAIPELRELTLSGHGAAGFLDIGIGGGDPASTFADQLDAMLGLADSEIQNGAAVEFGFAEAMRRSSNAHVTTVGYRRWLDAPRATMTRYCSLLQQFRSAVIEKMYPHFERHLRAEVRRLRAVADEFGPTMAFGTVHPCLSVTDDVVTMSGLQPHPDDWRPSAIAFKPMVAAPATRVNDFGYNAYRGTGQAAVGMATGGLRVTRHDLTDPLARLLGTPRGRVIRSLASLPGSTTDLAAELGFAPSTISHHLSFLTIAGVVEQRRHGAFVLYNLTDRGLHLSRMR